MSRKFLILYNPTSGIKAQHKTLIDKIIQYLKQHQLQYILVNTEYAGHARTICLNENLTNYYGILAVGGDGTFNEIINGIMNRKDSCRPYIGLLPGGTGNAVMHDLETTNLNKALKKITDNKIKSIDVMEINTNGRKEYSINIVGWGMVSDINILAEKLRLFGSARYTIASLYYIFNKKTRIAKITIDGKRDSQSQYLFSLVTNTIHTGKGMKVAPHAKMDDGLLDVIILDANISKINLLHLFPKIFSGEHIDSKFIRYIQAKEIDIIPEKKELLNIDGENRCYSPMTIKILPKQCNIFG